MTKINICLSGVVALSFCLMGCVTPHQSAPQKALLDQSGLDSAAEVKQAIKSLMNGRTVTISDSAFSKKSELLIEQLPVQNNGRTIYPAQNKTYVFTLWQEGAGCFVERKDTLERVKLKNARCMPAD